MWASRRIVDLSLNESLGTSQTSHRLLSSFVRQDGSSKFGYCCGNRFGTTKSAVSWTINEGNRHIRLIQDWPNPAETIFSQVKVPSITSYRNNRVANWVTKSTTRRSRSGGSRPSLNPTPSTQGLSRKSAIAKTSFISSTRRPKKLSATT
ncbi:hypothetical protein EDB81DRAFT_801915 [Dactylonectria macrodidyma]|uniref:Uncharacterized protein n=1 Tax=Dactylonectria macrodidyma TaxID=307937 RepID=A0A9P9IUT8_9HYPO|nr:hypothetical protein EDB81DRAFT_801915 [Dactylonectria macrodidyma]